MNKNTYTGLALAACLSFATTPLLAEEAPAADSAAPETKITEPLEPSELQRQQAEHNKANIPAPETSVKKPLKPSKSQKKKTKHSKANTTAPEGKIIEPLEPSELQRQQAEHNKAINK